MQLLDPLVTLPQPNDTTHWLLVTFLPLLWLKATMGSVLSFSAHSAELSRFCLLFQLHFVVVYSAVFADSCLAPPTPLCGCRFAVGALALRSRYFITTRAAVWALCHIRYFPWSVLLTVSLCLVHAGVSTSLNSVARLLLNAVYRLLLNVSDASLSFLPGSSRASCTSEPAWRLSGPCASASKCYSAGTQQHLLDLTVASTVSSESSAPVFPLCTLQCVLITPLASFSLSEYWLLYPSNRWHMSLWLDNVSFHSCMTLGPVLLAAPSVCRQISSTSTFMPRVQLLWNFDSLWRLRAVHVDVMHLCVGDFWHAFETVSLVKRSAIFASFLSLSNSNEKFDTPYSTVLLQTLLNVLLQALLSVDDSQHFDTLLQNLLYRVLRSMLGIDVLAEYAGSPHQFSSTSAKLARQLSVPRYSARISSMRVKRFLFPPSQNPSDVASKLLTMLTFLNTVSFLIVSPPNFCNFLLTVILAHIDLNSPRGEFAVVDTVSGISAVFFTALACSSAFFTSSWCDSDSSLRTRRSVTDNALEVSTIATTTFLFCVRVPLQDSSSEDLNLEVCSSSNSSLSPSMHVQLELLTPISRRGAHMNHSMFLGIDGLMSFTSSMNCIWCTVTVFIRILNHEPLLPTRWSDLVSSVTPRRSDLVLVSHVSHDETQVLVLHWLGIGNGSLDWRCLCAFTWLTLLDERILTLHNLLDMADLAASSFFTGTLIKTFAGAWGALLYNLVVRDTLLVKLIVGRARSWSRSWRSLSNSSSFSHRSFVLISRVRRF